MGRSTFPRRRIVGEAPARWVMQPLSVFSRVRARERLRKHLAEANVDTGVQYPLPLHLQKAYANLGGKQGDFPITERISSEILSLPMYPRLEAEQQRRIVQKIVESVAVASLP